MGLQEVYMVYGTDAVCEALRSPELTGWPIHIKRKVGEGRIDWQRVEKEIKKALEGTWNVNNNNNNVFGHLSVRSSGRF